MLLNDRKLTVPSDYIEGFVRANFTFLYQLVYDPMQRKLLPLNPHPPGMTAGDFPYAGAYPLVVHYMSSNYI